MWIIVFIYISENSFICNIYYFKLSYRLIDAEGIMKNYSNFRRWTWTELAMPKVNAMWLNSSGRITVCRCFSVFAGSKQGFGHRSSSFVATPPYIQKMRVKLNWPINIFLLNWAYGAVLYLILWTVGSILCKNNCLRKTAFIHT